jgi:hypothetical protein
VTPALVGSLCRAEFPEKNYYTFRIFFKSFTYIHTYIEVILSLGYQPGSGVFWMYVVFVTAEV